jgi:hypothetical protein
MKRPSSQGVQSFLFFLIVLALVGNVFFLFSSSDNSQGFGDLKITFIEADNCDSCFPLNAFEEYFSANGVTEDQIEKIAHNSFSGKRLIKKYDISKVPTAVVTGAVGEYEFMQGLVDQVGEMRNGAFVVTRVQPPYLDLETEEIKGEFELIYLDDQSCAECYDVSLHDEVFGRLAMQPAETKVVDVSTDEGRELIDRYFISAVPTILLRGDLDEYQSFQEIWESVGNTEDDGTYVLRQGVENMGTYKTIPDGEIIVPEIGGEEPLNEEN